MTQKWKTGLTLAFTGKNFTLHSQPWLGSVASALHASGLGTSGVVNNPDPNALGIVSNGM